MELIIKADDLGWTDGINAGIEKVARDGLLSATGCMPNMPSALRGIETMKKYSHISIGAHINVVLGKSVSDPRDLPHLTDKKGNFYSTSYYRKKKENGEDPLPWYEESVKEICAQIEKFKEYAGFKPAYLEGHAVPSVTFERALHDVAEEYGIVYLDFHDQWNEQYHIYKGSLGKYAMHIFDSDNPFEQFYADAKPYLLNDEDHILDKDRVLITFHPGFVDAQLLAESSFHGVRVRDCEALCSMEVREWIEQNHVRLINFNDLKKEFVYEVSR